MADDTRKEVVSLLSDRIKSTKPYKQLMTKLFETCQDTTLDNCADNDELFNLLMSRMAPTAESGAILNSVFTHLHGLESPSKSVYDEYIPEEPDWILNGRIKWLKERGCNFQSRKFCDKFSFLIRLFC